MYIYVATSLLLNFVGTQSSLYSQENHMVRVLLLKDRVILLGLVHGYTTMQVKTLQSKGLSYFSLYFKL
jgi:hypothetical protein